ncbi:MAG TPA: serine/threonine-protein kinase [Kofleriaceae bacterium]
MKLCPKCQKQFSDDANFCPVDAARLVPLQGGSAETDSLTARFELGDKIGGGRTGNVHRAADKQNGGAACAVKIVSPAVIALPGVAQRLERELKQLERVQSAGVAKVIASGKRGEETWVALEMLDGAQTIADAITARGPIPLESAAHLIEVVGEALIEAAQVGVVHRDLAPKNVLFAGSDIKLINFSLPVPTNDKVPGVPEFVAPEQVEGKPVDQRSNLYSLGALYYYVLTGQTVHAGSPDEVHRAHVGGAIRTPSSLAAVPGPVEAVIMRALDRSPTKRFLTVRQFVDEVGRVARGEADPRSTQPMGKVGRPKAELVQTLIGVRQGGGQPPAIVAPAQAAAVAPSTVIGMSMPQSPTVTPTHLSAPPMGSPVAVAAPTGVAASVPPPERSPWAPPAGAPNAAGPMAGAQAAIAQAGADIAATVPATPAAPIVAPPVVAAPVLAAPVVAAPVVAAPVVQNAPTAQGKKSNKPEGESKGKFRETMWFKKGELDAQAAQAAAEERAKSGKDAATDKADSMPIDERYKDDGSITRSDKEKYSLRTGATQMMQVQNPGDAGASMSSKVSEDALIGEMKGGRTWIVFAILAGLAGVAAIIYFAVM